MSEHEPGTTILHGDIFGVSDVSPWISLAVVGSSFVAVSAIALALLRSGYKLRH